MPTKHADVIILGVGAMGSAAADHLAAAGKSVIGIEQFTIGHALGSSHGGSRIIRQSYFEHPDYVPLLKRSYELFEELNEYRRAAGEDDILHQTGGLYFGDPETETFVGSKLAAEEYHLPHEILNAEQIRERFPQFTPDETDLGLYEERAGYVVPEATILTQVKRARENGAEILENETVMDCEPLAQGGVKVTTDRGIYTADTLVVTAGAWSGKLLSELRIPLYVERQVMHWFETGDQYDNLAAGPVYIHQNFAGAQIYGFPAIDGPDGGGKVAFFRAGSKADPNALDRTVTDEEKAKLQERLKQTLPALGEGASVDAKACMYTNTPDEHFVIGRDPRKGRRDVVFACGFSGHGFKFTPVVGELIKNMVVTGAPTCGIPLFDPLRFTEVRHAVGQLY